MTRILTFLLLASAARALTTYVPIPSIPTPPFGVTEDIAMYAEAVTSSTAVSAATDGGSVSVDGVTINRLDASNVVVPLTVGAQTVAVTTLTVGATTGLRAGKYLTVSGVTPSGYNGTWLISAVGSGNCTVILAYPGALTVAGTAVAQYLYDYGDDGATGLVPYRIKNGLPCTHYIDRSESGATDTSNPNGFTGASGVHARLTWPWGTLASQTITAGSCVQIKGGDASNKYSFSNGPSGTQVMGGTGTPTRPIFFYGIVGSEGIVKGQGTGSSPILYTWGNNVIIEHLKLGNGSDTGQFLCRPALKGAPIVNVCVRDCTCLGTGAFGSQVTWSTGGGQATQTTFDNCVGNLVMLRNTVSAYGDWQAATENDSVAAIYSQNAFYCWFLDNTVFHMGGDGIRLGADQGGTPSGSHHFVGRNLVYDNRENFLDIKQARQVIISENVAHGFHLGQSSNGEAIVSHYLPQNVWILNNRISDSAIGFSSTGAAPATDYYIIGNTFWNCTARAIYPNSVSGNFKIYNNTIHGGGALTGTGIESTGVINSLVLRNNIIYDVAGAFLKVDQSSVRDAAGTEVTNELYFKSGGGQILINWNAAYTSMAAFISATPEGDDSLEQDPLFVNAATNNYTLSALSPAINGFNWMATADAAFKTIFGSSVTVLKDDNGTSIVNPPYRGAYQGAIPATPPDVVITAPATLSVFNEGASINFTGVATDAEDGTITANIIWSSSIDGSLGTGGSITTSALSAGTHTIHAAITDSDANTLVTSITIIVNPVVVAGSRASFGRRGRVH